MDTVCRFRLVVGVLGAVAALSVGVLSVADKPSSEPKPKTPENLAMKATITADSQHSSPYLAAFVADGKIPAVGGCNGGGREWAAGGNNHPVSQLQAAGVDFATDAPMKALVDTMDSLVKQLESELQSLDML